MTDFLDRAKIAYVAEDDILHRLWGKFTLNVGVNQTCMAYETTYSGTLTPGEAHDTMVGAMREVVPLLKRSMSVDIFRFRGLHQTAGDLSPDGMRPWAGWDFGTRPSEVEMFAGNRRPYG